MRVVIVWWSWGEIMDKEKRFFEIRKVAEGERKISGHAVVYNSRSVDLGGFVEVIHPGFLSGVLGDDVRALVNHDENQVLGRTRSGTLRLEDTDIGLMIENDVPRTTWADDLLESMQRGDINQMSFAFSVRSGGDKWERLPDGTVLRHLLPNGAEQLFDVSVVTYPAYPATSAYAQRMANDLAHEIQADDGADEVPAAQTAEQARARNKLRQRQIQLLQSL